MNSELELLLKLIVNSVKKNIKLNKKLMRDILDVCEGHIREIYNSQGNYDHSTLKYNASVISKEANKIKRNQTRGEVLKLTHREHAVPLNILIPLINNLNKIDVDELHRFLMTNLRSVLITKQERDILDNGMDNLKNKMPPNWNNVDIYARFNAKNILLEDH